MKGAKASEHTSCFVGYLAGPSVCPNCYKRRAKFMSAFTMEGKCVVRVECPDCSLNMTHEKDFTCYRPEEYHYRRREWLWFHEMSERIEAEQEKLRLENAGSTVHSEVLGAGNTLLLPDKPRKRRRSSLNANVMRRRTRNRH